MLVEERIHEQVRDHYGDNERQSQDEQHRPPGNTSWSVALCIAIIVIGAVGHAFSLRRALPR